MRAVQYESYGDGAAGLKVGITNVAPSKCYQTVIYFSITSLSILLLECLSALGQINNFVGLCLI